MASSSDSEPPTLESLARRYLDLWQDQWSALAVDPEVAENFARLFQIIGQGAAIMAPFTAFGMTAGATQRQQFNDPFASTMAGRPVADPSSGTTSARAPHGGDADHAAELARRIAVLEERLAALEGAAPRPRRGPSGGTRRGRS